MLNISSAIPYNVHSGYEVEQAGMHEADLIMANKHYLVQTTEGI